MLNHAIPLLRAVPAAITDETIRHLSSAEGAQAAAPAGADFLDYAMQMIVGLGAVLALIVLLAWAARKWLPAGLARPADGERIELLSSRSLGPRRSLMLVRARGRVVLLGATAQQISCLTEWDEAMELEEPEDARAAAIDSFQQIMARHQGAPREEGP